MCGVCVMLGTFELLPNAHRNIERSNYLHELFLKRFATQQKKHWITLNFFFGTPAEYVHTYIDTIYVRYIKS